MTDIKQFVTSFATSFSWTPPATWHLLCSSPAEAVPRSRSTLIFIPAASGRLCKASLGALKVILKGKGFMMSLSPVQGGSCLISESPGLDSNSGWCSTWQGLIIWTQQADPPERFIIYCTMYNSYFPCGREARIKHPDLYSLTSGGMISNPTSQDVNKYSWGWKGHDKSVSESPSLGEPGSWAPEHFRNFFCGRNDAGMT